MIACNQICKYNFNEYGCLKPESAVCPMSNAVAREKPMTNADRIRDMNDEELAEFLVHIAPTNCRDCEFSCGWRCQPDRQDYSDAEKCKEGRRRWLQQPVKEDA